MGTGHSKLAGVDLLADGCPINDMIRELLLRITLAIHDNLFAEV